MLFKPPSTAKSNLVVTGRSLAHSKARVSQRALLVADVLAGEVDYKPTIGQLARDARVSVSSVRAARQIRDDLGVRLGVLNGCCGLQTAAARHKKENGNGHKNGHGKMDVSKMTPADWDWASAEERQQYVLYLGIASVWEVIDQLTR